MDQFLQQKYTKDIDMATGKPCVAWVRFDDIRDKWEAALASDTPNHVNGDILAALDRLDVRDEETRKRVIKAREEAVIPNFIQGVQNALKDSLEGMSKVKEIDMSRGMPLDRGLQAYQQSIQNDPFKDVEQEMMELNRMVSSMSGADKLLGW